jgi:hypothetical protein
MWGFHSVFPFDKVNYTQSSHHFLADARINDGPFVFLRALGQYDAQWYLRIATNGYPAHPTNINMQDKTAMDGLTYAFFPLYPLLIATVNVLLGNVELSAFLLSNLLIILNTISLFLLIQKLYNPSIAVKTVLLLFLFPFSIFFRSYFAEGLQLFLLVWFAFFLTHKRFVPSAICLGLLNVAKGSSMLLAVLYFVLLVREVYIRQLSVSKAILCLIFIIAPLSLWVAYNYVQTGNPLYFYAIQKAWDSTPAYLHLLQNLWTILNIYRLPLHSFHASFINTALAVYIFLLLIVSRKHLQPLLWWISFLIWLTPFVSIDLMSFSRYQSISFPLYLFIVLLAKDNRIYGAIATVLFSLLLLTSLLFVNWYWIG